MDLCGFGLGDFLPHSQSHYLKPRSRSVLGHQHKSGSCPANISLS